MEILKIMQKYNFSDHEISLFFLVSKYGEISASDLNSSSSLTKLQIHSALHQLLEKGLLSIKNESDHKVVKAVNREALFNYLKERARKELKKVEDLKSEIINMESSVLPQIEKVRSLRGKEGIRIIQKEICLANNDVIEFYDLDIAKTVFTAQEKSDSLKRREGKMVYVKAVCSSSRSQKVKVHQDDLYTKSLHVPKSTYKLPCDIVVYDDHVGFIMVEKEPYSLVIDSHEVATSLRTIFNLAFERLELLEAEK